MSSSFTFLTGIAVNPAVGGGEPELPVVQSNSIEQFHPSAASPTIEAPSEYEQVRKIV